MMAALPLCAGMPLAWALSAALWPSPAPESGTMRIGGVPTTEQAVTVAQGLLPLRTKGRDIVGQDGVRVHLRCVNWYGAHLPTMAVGGLHVRSLADIAAEIPRMGFNCVRLPFSLEMQFGGSMPEQWAIAANPELQNRTALDVFDATVEALTKLELLVVLNTHQGRAMWCCSEDDGEGLWYSKDYPEDVWIRSLTEFGKRYAANPYVAGFDIRNELRRAGGRSPEWGSGDPATDWGAAAVRGCKAVAAANAGMLAIVEGLSFARDLSALRQPNAPRPHVDEPELAGRVVYSVHEYSWFDIGSYLGWLLRCAGLGQVACLIVYTGLRACARWKGFSLCCRRMPALVPFPRLACLSAVTCLAVACWLSSYRRYEANRVDRWAFLLDGDEAPVWLGEFGTDGPSPTDIWRLQPLKLEWWRNTLGFVRSRQMDYAYWALNGDKSGAEETFGILDANYSKPRYSWLLPSLP